MHAIEVDCIYQKNNYTEVMPAIKSHYVSNITKIIYLKKKKSKLLMKKHF